MGNRGTPLKGVYTVLNPIPPPNPPCLIYIQIGEGGGLLTVCVRSVAVTSSPSRTLSAFQAVTWLW